MRDPPPRSPWSSAARRWREKDITQKPSSASPICYEPHRTIAVQHNIQNHSIPILAYNNNTYLYTRRQQRVRPDADTLRDRAHLPIYTNTNTLVALWSGDWEKVLRFQIYDVYSYTVLYWLVTTHPTRHGRAFGIVDRRQGWISKYRYKHNTHTLRIFRRAHPSAESR